ncbi:MAG: CHAT domain-containing protein [Acidobacteria bacterium]|nr:CHAT domain-containing protein [Acidobacteriota bacterium]
MFLSVSASFGQTMPTKLKLGAPIVSQIKGGDTQTFSLSLEADQTARVEIVQDGIDVSLFAIDPKGEKFIETESPSGLFGDDLMLVTAKVTGEFTIGVQPADPRSPVGKYTIVLKRIRPTVSQDFEINEAAKNITKLAYEADAAKYRGTVEGRREALAKWKRIAELSKIKKDRVWEGVAYISYGLIHDTLGEFQSALDAYLLSLEVWQELGIKQYEASALNNLGVVYHKIGEFGKAVPYYNQALEIQRAKGDIKSVGVYLNNLGNLYSDLNDYEKAETFYLDSLEIKRKDESIRGKRSLGASVNNLGKMLTRKGEIENGIKYLVEGYEIRKSVGDRWGEANSLLNLGKVRLDSGDREKAFEDLRISNQYSTALGDRQMQAESFYLLAVAEKERGNIDKALENVSSGLDLVEQIRSELIGSRARYTYLSTVHEFYDLYTDLLVSRYEKTNGEADLTKSLQISERSRSRSLIELLEEAKVNFRQGIDAGMLANLKSSQEELDNKYNTRENLLRGNAKPEQIAKVEAEINSLNNDVQALQSRIRRENPKYSDLIEGRTVFVAEIQNLLDEDTVFLEYKLGEKRSFVWLVTKDNVEISILPPRRIIESKAREYYNLIVANEKGQTANIEKLARDLGGVLLTPFASKIVGKRMAIVADGVLQYTPFSSLTLAQEGRSGLQPIVEKNEIVMLPSASVLEQIRESRGGNMAGKKAIAIFADPVFDPKDPRITGGRVTDTSGRETDLTSVLRDFQFGQTLPRLLSSRQEARDIAGLIDKNRSTVRLDFEANVRNLENGKLADYRILHFATHGLLNTSNPELSGLVFSLYDKTGQPRDGFLSLNDIYNLEISSDMVVLSACQTALGKEIRGEGLIGLSRGFLYAGTNRIVASLWKVDDSATAEFMKRFYRNHLEMGMSASAALRAAKLEMRKIPRFRSPYYWSAFTLLGEWQK